VSREPGIPVTYALKFPVIWRIRAVEGYYQFKVMKLKNIGAVGHPWLSPLIPVTWEAEMGKLAVPGQATQLSCKTPSPK
jgi:hypothetical protein